MAALIILQQARALRRERVFRDRNNPMDYLTDKELISRYRFPRASILDLCALINDDVGRPTDRSHSIPVSLQVLVTLRVLAKGDYQSESADIHGLSKTSVCRSLHIVCAALCQRLDNIKFPNTYPELRSIKEEFHQTAGFPNVVGAIDGTIIPIQGMSGQTEHLYVSRKGFHSLNIQAVVDAKMKFINLNARFPGATHDAYILQSSQVPTIMEGLGERCWLLGDSGYPLKTWLMTPLANPITQAEQNYNRAHARTRTIVERAFGVLKARFRCLHKTGGSLSYSPIKCAKIVETCFRLHNKAVEDKLPLPRGDQVPPMICHNNVCQNTPAMDAKDLRNQIVRRF